MRKKVIMLAMMTLMVVMVASIAMAQSENLCLVKVEKPITKGFSGSKQDLIIPVLQYAGHDPARNLFLKIDWEILSAQRKGNLLIKLEVKDAESTIKNLYIMKVFGNPRGGTTSQIEMKISLVEEDGEKVIRQSEIRKFWISVL